MVEIPDKEYQKLQSRLKELEAAVTRCNQVEEKLRENEGKYRHLYENSPVGIGLSAIDGKVLDCNRAMETITGYTIEELKQLNLANTYEKPEERKALLEELNRSGKVINFPVRLKHKDGTSYDVLLSVSKIHVGRADVFQTMCIDITESKKMEEEISARMREAELLNEVAVGRELKMIELEKEVNSLLKELGREPKYKGG